MNTETPSKLRNGKLFSKIPVLSNTNANFTCSPEMESSSRSQTTSREDLVEAQRNLESKFDSLNSEITELRSLLTTLVQQNSAAKNTYTSDTRQRRYFTTSTDNRFASVLHVSFHSLKITWFTIQSFGGPMMGPSFLCFVGHVAPQISQQSKALTRI